MLTVAPQLALLTEIATPTAMAEQEDLIAALEADQADAVDDLTLETRGTQAALEVLAT